MGSPNAGLDAAIAATNSKDPMKTPFGIFDLMSIDTPEARQYLNSLPNSPDPNIKLVLNQLAHPLSKEIIKGFSQFERLR
jgi:hypothetical protein